MQTVKLKKANFTPMRILATGFAVVIFAGALLLNLPISAADGKSTPFIDCFFVATSATCVTGLVTVDTGTHWSYFGKTVIMILIEVGGLGFMSFATLLALLLGRKISLQERLIMQESLSSFKLQGMVKMARMVLIFTFSVQIVAALILSTQFIPEFGWGKGIYYSIFHAISGFCNAGIDLFGNFTSVTRYYNNPVVIITLGSLIIIGGLGFFVWQDLYFNGIKKLSTNSKLVLTVSAILIFGGMALMYIFEMNNGATIKNMDFKSQLLSSWFAAVTPRTAGFNSISTADMTPGGRFLTIILMFIGGSPGSTAGGIKITTFSILFLTVLSVVKGREDVEVYKKRIGRELVTRAISITFIAMCLVIIVSMILCVTEQGASLEYIIYETVSAFGTVGLTLGLTPDLSTAGKIVLAFTMYCGRVGPLTLAIALARKNSMKGIRYPEDKIIVG